MVVAVTSAELAVVLEEEEEEESCARAERAREEAIMAKRENCGLNIFDRKRGGSL